jgi:peptide/nickel transport system substrate-binding protein/oligopeptide transport system substrate-binding protein
MSPPGFPGYNPDLVNKYQYYDLEKAKQYLAEAGYPDGQGFPRIEMWTRGSEWADIADAVSAMLKQNLNLDFPVVDRPNKVFMDSLYAGEIPLALTRYQFDYVDASNMLGIWINGRRHTWKNSKYDELIAMADTETQDPEKRLQLYSDAETILLDEVASVMVAHPKFPELIKSFFYSPEFKPNQGGQEGYKPLDNFTLIRGYLTQEAVTRLGKPWPP